MGYRIPSAVGVVTNPATGTGGEQILNTAGPLSPLYDGSPLLILWNLTYVSGATIIKPQIRIRRGNTAAGTLLYASGIFTDVTTQLFGASGFVIDTLAGLADVFYVLTVDNTNAGTSAAMTIQSLFVMAL